ncbi:MAG: hypothetical protein LLP51_05270 [Halorhodospira halophila]|uniref:hypothetical protein n=1 Tax=Halorhodospira TaxID=85108 RepID=UPI001914A9FD|nr:MULTISPECIES: hypothetical protein [Halorhodospira]MBK5936645.1 hypothetical protein [Halorhodospira halophila]MCC3750795.1 hypothetical protein [Halorhodospira halophila]MCG5527380.1 hypothetical protein [Halorhodospira halophila]MCG5538458.1 hypothetical protein [Halorhodospira sp. 9622]MCG5543626.1 hypothetical protein [Halorhodospira sp. 9628]
MKDRSWTTAIGLGSLLLAALMAGGCTGYGQPPAAEQAEPRPDYSDPRQWPGGYQMDPDAGDRQAREEMRATGTEMRNLGRDAELEAGFHELQQGIRQEQSEILGTFPEIYGRDAWRRFPQR